MSLEPFRAVPCIETVSYLVRVCKGWWVNVELQKAAITSAHHNVDSVRGSRGLLVSFAESHGMRGVQGGTLLNVAHVPRVNVVFRSTGHVCSLRPYGSYQSSGYVRAGRTTRADHTGLVLVLIVCTGDGADTVRCSKRTQPAALRCNSLFTACTFAILETAWIRTRLYSSCMWNLSKNPLSLLDSAAAHNVCLWMSCLSVPPNSTIYLFAVQPKVAHEEAPVPKPITAIEQSYGSYNHSCRLTSDQDAEGETAAVSSSNSVTPGVDDHSSAPWQHSAAVSEPVSASPAASQHAKSGAAVADRHPAPNLVGDHTAIVNGGSGLGDMCGAAADTMPQIPISLRPPGRQLSDSAGSSDLGPLSSLFNGTSGTERPTGRVPSWTQPPPPAPSTGTALTHPRTICALEDALLLRILASSH